MSTDSHFSHHVFFCTNKRANGEACCADHGVDEIRAYAKDQVKALKLNGVGKVRINSAGCCLLYTSDAADD